MNLPREEILARSRDYRDTLARMVDLAEKAIKEWTVVVSDFCSPPEAQDTLAAFASLTEIQSLAWGGYEQAERTRLAFARKEVPIERTDLVIAAVEVRGNFLFDPASHRDFLGAVLNTGIVREKVGDILILKDRGAQILVVPELVEFIQQSLKSVRSVSVTVEPLALDNLEIRPPRAKAMTTVEASMRLDAVASAGFGLSRAKMAESIETGDVRVNWKTALKSSHTVAEGDRITMSGKGRLEVGKVEETKKGRYRIELVRYS
jgi:photosystem II S4 domain protein